MVRLALFSDELNSSQSVFEQTRFCSFGDFGVLVFISSRPIDH